MGFPAPSLLAYLHEDFAQRHERRAQLRYEDAAHKEVPQLSPEVLQIKPAVSTGALLERGPGANTQHLQGVPGS